MRERRPKEPAGRSEPEKPRRPLTAPRRTLPLGLPSPAPGPVLWLLKLLGVCLALRYMLLPTLRALAEMTPPGVDRALLRSYAEQSLRSAKLGPECDRACEGLTCPKGWTTGRAQDDQCKCICVREKAGEKTQWDLEREAKGAASQDKPKQPSDAAANVAAEQGGAAANKDNVEAHGAHAVAEGREGG